MHYTLNVSVQISGRYKRSKIEKSLYITLDIYKKLFNTPSQVYILTSLYSDDSDGFSNCYINLILSL